MTSRYLAYLPYMQKSIRILGTRHDATFPFEALQSTNRLKLIDEGDGSLKTECNDVKSELLISGVVISQ